jgi:myosin-5
MSLRKGSKVWAEDRDLAWVAAEALDFVGKQILVVTTSGKKVSILFFSKEVIFVRYWEVRAYFPTFFFEGFL